MADDASATTQSAEDRFVAYFENKEEEVAKAKEDVQSMAMPGATGAGTGTNEKNPTGGGMQGMGEDYSKFFDGTGATVEEYVNFINDILAGNHDLNELLKQNAKGINARNAAQVNEKFIKQLGDQLKTAVEQVDSTKDNITKMSSDAIDKLRETIEKATAEAHKTQKEIVENAVKEAIEAAKETVAPKIEIKLGDSPVPTTTIDDDIIHMEYERSLKVLHSLGILWLCGPAGSGKTHMAGQLAKAFNLPFYAISCTAGLSESWFIGRKDLTGEYLEPKFLHFVENGGIVLLDEFDAADPNTSLIINSLLSNGYLSVPMRVDKPMAIRHKDFKVIFATNTWGFGPDGQYSGREGLDASTRDRAVVAKIGLSYSRKIEAAFLKPKTLDFKEPPRIAFREPVNLADAFYAIRKAITDHRIRRIMSTRAFEQAARLRAGGFKDSEILELYFADWSETEREKALNGVAWIK